MTLFVFIVVVILVLLILNRWLSGADMSYLDQTQPRPIMGEPPSDESAAVAALVKTFTSASKGKGGLGRSRITAMRETMDAIGNDREYVSEIRPCSTAEIDAPRAPIFALKRSKVPASVSAPAGEWVLAPGYDPARRLLYIHGGAFMAGSPKSHRIITDKLSRVSGAAVFAVDYRLMPEHSREAMREDCAGAYRWLLDNGPEGPAALTSIAIAGDSAGGCLTLGTLAYAKAEGWRAPNAAIAISPVTDMTLTTPSVYYNRHTDLLLGPAFGQVIRQPAMLRNLASALLTRRSPASPVLSPLRGDLSGLAPTLIQVSTHEMLFDDAHRYYQRATAAGSPTTLQCFANMVHVWHMFSPQLPEAEFAFEQIKTFLADCGCIADVDLKDSAA